MKRRISRRQLLGFGGAGLGGLGLYKGIEIAGFGPGATRAGEVQAGFGIGHQGVRESLGRYIYLTPQKLGGGTHAVDIDTHKTMAWISYWNYGDTCPISHHLAAFPPDNGDPYQGYEFVNSTQGGQNILIYGLRTRIQERGLLDRYGQGNHIYRVGYDGRTGQMELLEDIAETTGIGLGGAYVHLPRRHGVLVRGRPEGRRRVLRAGPWNGPACRWPSAPTGSPTPPTWATRGGGAGRFG
jgi:thiocyanate desulfurase